MGGKKNVFTRFLTNKTTVTLVGIVLGLGVLVGFYIYRVTKQVNPTRIPVAKRAISATEEITKDDIEYVKVSKSFLKKRDVYQSVTNLVGKYVSTEHLFLREECSIHLKLLKKRNYQMLYLMKYLKDIQSIN